MTTDTLLSIFQAITLVSLGMCLIFVLIAFYYFRLSRREAFWRQRRTAGNRGLQFSIVALFLLVIGSAFCMISMAISFESGGGTEIADLPPTATMTPTFTDEPATITPTMEITATQVIQPTLENTLEVTITPTAIIATLPATASVRSMIRIEAIDDQISDDWQPVEPSTTFNAIPYRLYFYINYRDMAKETRYSAVLLKDGAVIRQQEYQWGVMPAVGDTFFFFGNASGFDAGNYEIRVMIGDALLSSSEFTIQALPQ